MKIEQRWSRGRKDCARGKHTQNWINKALSWSVRVCASVSVQVCVCVCVCLLTSIPFFRGIRNRHKGNSRDRQQATGRGGYSNWFLQIPRSGLPWPGLTVQAGAQANRLWAGSGSSSSRASEWVSGIQSRTSLILSMSWRKNSFNVLPYPKSIKSWIIATLEVEVDVEMEMEGQYVRGGYMPRVRGSAPPPHLRTESQGPGRLTLRVPLAVFPFPSPSPSPSPCLPLTVFLSRYPNRSPHLFAVPRTWVYFALAFLFLFFACFASLCFALFSCLVCSRLFSLHRWILSWLAPQRGDPLCRLYFNSSKGGPGRAQLRVKCSSYTQLCVCVSEVYLAKGDRVVLTSNCCIVNDFTD